MRRLIAFPCESETLLGTLDAPDSGTVELDGRRIDPAAEITALVLAVPAYPRAQVLVLKTR